MDSFVFRPVAFLRTPFREKFGVPRQSGLVPEAEGRIEFLPAFSAPEFLRGLEAFSHLWLLTAFHHSEAWSGSAVVRPPRLGGNDAVGVFASRSPNRPNPVGLSLVAITGIEPGVVRVSGVDAVDGTPVLDVKPYLPWSEAIPDARSDWAPTPPQMISDESVIVPARLAAKLGEANTRLIRQLLKLQLQPAYHGPQSRTYGMSVAGWNIRWTTQPNGTVEVCEVERMK